MQSSGLRKEAGTISSQSQSQTDMENGVDTALVAENGQHPNDTAPALAVINEKEQEEKNFKTLQLVVFKLENEEYALRIEQIKEVVLTPKVTQVPQTPKHIKGVANIRGNILAIVDLEDRFGLATEEEKEPGRFTLVLDDREFKVGILVRNVPNTIEISEDTLDESPNIVHDSVVDERAIEAIAKVGDRLIILLDIHRVLRNDNLGSLVEGSETKINEDN